MENKDDKNSSNDAIEYFSQNAEKYDDDTHRKSLGTEYLSLIETDFVKKILEKIDNDKDRRSLEIGAGTGRFTPLLLDRGHKVEIIEAADGMIKVIKEKFKQRDINVKKMNAGEGFPYVSDYFDCILAMRVLKYIPNWKKTVSEAYRTLKKDGCFIFSISNFYSVAYFKGRAKYFLFRPKEVIKHLEDLGFDIIKISTTSRLPFPIYCKINSRYWLRPVIFVENVFNKVLPFWLFSRAILICAKKSTKDTIQR